MARETRDILSLYSLATNNNFVDVGFCKLDPIINGDICGFNLESLNLDSDKKTILYAPTFYPSSLEKFPKNFPEDFQEFNIIIKPHYFSLSKEKYRNINYINIFLYYFHIKSSRNNCKYCKGNIR